jgi:hypothetical protein
MEERHYPPVTEVGMASLGLIVAAGIYLASHIPEQAPLAPAIILLILSALLLVFNLVSLTRVDGFPWDRFFAVARWALLAYCITAGLIAFVFIRNHVSGATLVILLLSLVVYALQVPVLIGFTVARYYEPEPVPA